MLEKELSSAATSAPGRIPGSSRRRTGRQRSFHPSRKTKPIGHGSERLERVAGEKGHELRQTGFLEIGPRRLDLRRAQLGGEELAMTGIGDGRRKVQCGDPERRSELDYNVGATRADEGVDELAALGRDRHVDRLEQVGALIRGRRPEVGAVDLPTPFVVVVGRREQPFENCSDAGAAK
jgi:hypothetical protein